MTGDLWHVTYDTWHSVRWTFSQNFSFPALLVWDWECFECIYTNHQLVTLGNDKAVCRTAPTSPGLLKTVQPLSCSFTPVWFLQGSSPAVTTGHNRLHQPCQEEALPGEGVAGHAEVGVKVTTCLIAAGFSAGLLLLQAGQEQEQVLVQSALNRNAGLTGPTVSIFTEAVSTFIPKSLRRWVMQNFIQAIQVIMINCYHDKLFCLLLTLRRHKRKREHKYERRDSPLNQSKWGGCRRGCPGRGHGIGPRMLCWE